MNDANVMSASVQKGSVCKLSIRVLQTTHVYMFSTKVLHYTDDIVF